MTDTYSIIPTTHGYVKGVQRFTIYDDVYYSFEGVPYARPPLGELRFKAPEPPQPWSHVLDCLQCPPKPVQRNLYNKQLEGDEDCLYLNVYAKQLHTAEPLPVMVYIFGGAFRSGAATRDECSPDYFMAEDVVLVTVNYRLGPLGFLSLQDPTLQAPGNAGLKDQIAALRWLKQNSLNFNGDPNNITIFGISAGSAAIHYLMMSANAEGLFHKAILQSGVTYNHWSCTPRTDYAQRLAKACGYSGDLADEAAVCAHLRQVDARELCGQYVLTTEERRIDAHFAFGPCVEPYDGPDCIVHIDPLQLMRHSWSNNIPIMIGGTSFEGLVRHQRIKADPGMVERLITNPEIILPPDVHSRKTPQQCRELSATLVKWHFGDAPLNYENRLCCMDMYSMKMFWLGFLQCLYDRHLYANAPTYLYRFDVDSPTLNLFRHRYCGPGLRGVAHADDTSYLFYSVDAWKLPLDSDEYKSIRRMVSLWTAFARHGNPNCAAIAPVVWQPSTSTTPHHCLNIRIDGVQILELPEHNTAVPWLKLYDDV